MYNSPYSPTFSPIEELFGTIKGKLVNKGIQNTMKMLQTIVNIMSEIEINLIRKYYIHSYLHMIKTIE